MRRGILEVLGHVVHGRISMEALQAGLLVDLQRGIEPLAFGVYWTKEHLDVLHASAQLMEAAFHLLKWLQAPVHPGRLEDAALLLDQIRPALPAMTTAMAQMAIKPRTPTHGATRSHSTAPTADDNRRVG